MKIKNLALIPLLALSLSCAREFSILSTDVPQAVMTSFNNRYPGATDVEWEVEKEDGKLYFEAEFKINGREMEAYFRPDGTFTKEE
jgi:hypothetical protein